MISVIFTLFLGISLPRTTYGIIGGTPAQPLKGAKGVAFIDMGYGIVDPPHCNGAVIASRFVLTLGDCCSDDKYRTRVHVGSTTPFESGQFYKQADYQIIGSGSSPGFQLCVILLERDVHFNENLTALALPSKSNSIDDKTQTLHAFGYGSIQIDEPTDPADEAIHNYIFLRLLSSEMMAIEFPSIDVKQCERFFGVPATGQLKLRCHGYLERMRRLMLDDNGAPVVGSKDNVVYTIMATHAPLRPGNIWTEAAFPTFGIDVYSARDEILAAMGRLSTPDASR